MLKLVVTLLIGLVGAAIVHIVVVFAMPRLASNNSWGRLDRLGPLFDVVRIDPQRTEATTSATNPEALTSTRRDTTTTSAVRSTKEDIQVPSPRIPADNDAKVIPSQPPRTFASWLDTLTLALPKETTNWKKSGVRRPHAYEVPPAATQALERDPATALKVSMWTSFPLYRGMAMPRSTRVLSTSKAVGRPSGHGCQSVHVFPVSVSSMHHSTAF